MMLQNKTCPIWGTSHSATVSPSGSSKSSVNDKLSVDDSTRAGGSYEITTEAAEMVTQLKDSEKAALTTWLVDQRVQRIEYPLVTVDVINLAVARPNLPVYQRANRLLRFMTGQVPTIGDSTQVNEDTHAAFAWSESTMWSEVEYCLRYLREQGWIRGTSVQTGAFVGEVTVAGYSRIADQATNVDLSQVFVAMWFDNDLVEAYERGIKPAIVESGFTPLRIDQKEHINKIDDEIIAEIRRSRFLVADFTHGNDGARGGVYYEAGFALGLNLPVIFTCHEDSVKSLHFDTNHYNHIIWTTPEELCEKLRNRILAVIVERPRRP